MSSLPKRCSNGDCNYASDGKCVEGYELEDCPHLKPLAVDDIDEAPRSAAPPPPAPRMLSLHSGETLDHAEASTLQRRRRSRVIGMIAPNDAGKTSLIACVFDLLQVGSIDGIGFSGSSTLIGFEKACHDAREASRRPLPHMERTTVGVDAKFFHLDLRDARDELVSLFVGDRSGEDYLAATDEVSRAGEFFELRRADTVALLANGRHLVEPEFRHQAKAMTFQVVDALIESGAIRSGCRLAIVLTKQDAILASARSQIAARDFNEVAAAIVDRHQDYFAEIRTFVVAASPTDVSKVARGEGVAALLRYWLEPLPPVPADNAAEDPGASRTMDIFTAAGR